MIAALLMGRKGSLGFPGKNTYPVLGRPLGWYPMNAALKSKYVDKVYTSTNDEKVIELALKHGVEVIERPAHLCTPQALIDHAFVHGYEEIVRRRGEKPELLVLLMCNAVTILAETIDEGIRILRQNPDFDSAVTVSRYNMWSPLRARRIDDDGLLHPFVPFETFGDPKTMSCDRDSQGDAWFADMGVSIVRPRTLENIEEGLLPQRWMGQKIYPLKQEAGFDLDYEWQITQAEWWLGQHGFKEAPLK